MTKWTSWTNIDDAGSRCGPFDCFGIYQIRAVDQRGHPIPIYRLVGADRNGVLYVGQSGYRWQKTNRTIANRIREFIHQQHSGGKTYERAKKTLQKTPEFSHHHLQVRARILRDKKDIDLQESRELHNYFLKHGELPLCNSRLPRHEERS